MKNRLFTIAKNRVVLRIGEFTTEVGWYWGDTFAFFDLTIFEIGEYYVTAFQLTILGHLSICIGWSK